MKKRLPILINWYYHKILLTFYQFQCLPDHSILSIYHGDDFFHKKLGVREHVSVHWKDLKKLSSQRFDCILIPDTLIEVEDIQSFFHQLKKFVLPHTRIIINHYNFIWRPAIEFSELLGLKKRQERKNWLTLQDITNILILEGFQTIKKGRKILMPIYIPILSSIMNRYVANLPFFNALCFTNYLIAKPQSFIQKDTSVSIIIPTRNEKGNIENIIRSIPKFGTHQEFLFIEGHSRDQTWDEIQRVKRAYSRKDIHVLKQKGIGKADAVRLGFSKARGTICMIYDADLSTPAEDLIKFYRAFITGKGEFISGCRLVYPVEKEAMRFLNMVGNHFFSLALSWILNQHIKDTLCGTKVISRENYKNIVKNRTYFGNFDPFGDFDLLFGASKLNLQYIEIPVRYQARRYGKTNISRFRHGLMLFRMTVFGLYKLKFV